MSQSLESLVTRLEKVTERLEKTANNSGSSAPQNAPQTSVGGSSQMVDQFEKISNQMTGESLKFANALADEHLTRTIQIFQSASQYTINLLNATLKFSKPSAQAFPQLLTPITQFASDLQSIKSNYPKKQPLFNVVCAFIEGYNVFGWVSISPTPVPFINEMKDAMSFYSNRAFKEFKDKDETVINLLQGFNTFITELAQFVKQWHTTGLVWKGSKEMGAKDMEELKSHAPSASQSSSQPKSTNVQPAATAPTPTVAPSTTGLFSELNKGGAITSGLKKVEKSQMTHKNPELRASGVVKSKEETGQPTSAPQVSAKAAVKPPVFELQGSKWVVEHQMNNKNIIIENSNLKQVVYIFNCHNSIIQVKNKVNSVTLDNCNKTSVVVDSVVSTLDTVNCKSIQLQVMKSAPTVFNIYLDCH
eukprot:NODE_12_length_54577_cov_0.384100.p10 type:complete len:418 gc:universal NODE_12_length_54577_cov_0.384100:14992-16245(+)